LRCWVVHTSSRRLDLHMLLNAAVEVGRIKWSFCWLIKGKDTLHRCGIWNTILAWTCWTNLSAIAEEMVGNSLCCSFYPIHFCIQVREPCRPFYILSDIEFCLNLPCPNLLCPSSSWWKQALILLWNLDLDYGC
jgi:hypothetical protein